MLKGWTRIGLALVATMGTIGWDHPLGTSISPKSVVPVVMATSHFGPYSTRANYGYETANRVSPLIPQSYSSQVHPQMIGVQFVADSPANLQGDHFQFQVQGPKGPVGGKIQVLPHGLVAYQFPHPLNTGQYRVAFWIKGFAAPVAVWHVKVSSHAAALVSRPSSANTQSLQTLNALRQSLNESAVAWNMRLATAAQAHANYLLRFGYNSPSFHRELSGRPGFTGVTPWARDLSFGWPSTLDGEVGIEWHHKKTAMGLIQDLINTVYHRLSLLSPNLYTEGEGETVGQTGAVVMDLGFGYVHNLPKAIAYPYAGQVGVPDRWMNLENPNPVPGGTGHIFGYPITVDLPTVSQLIGAHLTLSYRGKPVAAYVDQPNQNAMAANQIGLVPKSPLKSAAVYHVTFTAEAKFNQGVWHPITLRWQFATGGPDSVALIPISHHQLKVSIVTSGNGHPLNNHVIRLYKFWDGKWALISSGVTNARGITQFAGIAWPKQETSMLALSPRGSAAIIKWGG